MGKALVRLTIIGTATYFALSYLFAQFLGIDILLPWYNIPFELCVVVYAFSEGKYHCKYIKYTALAILVSDIITQLDNSFNFLFVELHNIIPLFLIILGVAIGCILAIRHFILVRKLNKRKHGKLI
jgi:uncharacterized integral membrane protein